MIRMKIKRKDEISEQYTTITCRNVKCKHHRRYLGDMHCNCKYIVITEEGKCYYLENKEE